MENNKELEKLRTEIRTITGEIIKLVDKRMQLATKVGHIKSKLMIEVEDEVVENEMRDYVLKLSEGMNINREFLGKLLNLLLVESKRIQITKCQRVTDSINHMSIFLKAKQMERSGKKIIHLEVGEPDYLPPISIKYAMSQAFDRKYVKYTETLGIPNLRKSISNKYDNLFDENNIIITPGARFAIFGAMLSIVNSGDEVIILEPAWPAYKQCAEYIGAKSKIIRTQLENRWEPEFGQIEDSITNNTKMLVLNYPNNPTGKILDNRKVKRLIDIANEHDMFILSDEVYSGYSYKKFESLLYHNYEKSVIVSSFSKNYAMTGFRIGYAISNKEIIEKVAKIQALAVTSVAEPMQYAALTALKKDFSIYSNLMKKRLDFMKERLSQMPIEFYEPDGGMYYFVRIRKNNVLKVIEDLLDRGVAVAPGIGFGSTYDDFIRISACQPLQKIDKGLKIIEKMLGR